MLLRIEQQKIRILKMSRDFTDLPTDKLADLKNKENLNRYLSNLAVLVTKTHNLHWNVVGARFKAIHEYTESLYDYYFEKFDDVAETFKMKGEYPLVKVADYLKHATVKELDAKEAELEQLQLAEAN